MVNLDIHPARRHNKRQLTLVPGEPITGIFFTFTPLYPSFIFSTEAAAPTPVDSAPEQGKTTTKDDYATQTSEASTPTSTALTGGSATTTAVAIPSFPTDSTPTASLSYTGLDSPSETPDPSSGTNGGAALSSATQKSGISGGGVAAIAIVFIIIFLGGAAFFVRRRAMAKRRRRTTWGDDLYPRPFNDTGAAQSEKSMPYAFVSASGSGSVQPPTITPPPTSYNNPSQQPIVNPSSAFSTTTASTRSTNQTRGKAVVQCTFIPSMHDELNINTGEVLTIETEYDDGWALCSNARGEQGMVPVECLKRSDGSSAPPTDEESDWRSQQRASSLLFRDGVRY